MSFYVSVACDRDRCDSELSMYYMSKMSARQIAVEAGWLISKSGEAICPKCRQAIMFGENKAARTQEPAPIITCSDDAAPAITYSDNATPVITCSNPEK